MRKKLISKEWIFSCPEMRGKNTVDLPHDYVIQLPRDEKALGGVSNGFFTGTTGEYVKFISLDESKHIMLDIDGAYMCSQVFLNDSLLQLHPYGYTPFLVDISQQARRGEINKILIKTRNVQPSTRWYSGAGVYRDVFLWTGGSIRIEPRDVFITTQTASKEKAVLRVLTDITADDDAAVSVEITIKNADSADVVSVQKGATVHKGVNRLTFDLEVNAPRLWDVESPYLYTFFAKISQNEAVLDTYEMPFGIRTISANPRDGLLINGKSVKLRGGCIHHDHGGLGAASFPAAERRKVSLLKKAGFNAIRIAHNPPSLALLEACDEIGMFVMDEAFDMWNIGKNELDYSLWFPYCWKDDIRDMISRDRNHPCVISYSIGNEIPERSGISNGYQWSQTLADEIRKYDSTKLVTAGVCDVWDEPATDEPQEYKDHYLKEYWQADSGDFYKDWDKKTEAYMKPLDIVGYNYLYERYEKDHENYPDRLIWGSETHALNIFHSWNSVLRNSYVLGDFTWTAYDNLGEVGTGRGIWSSEGEITGICFGAYPWRTCYQGDFDLCGYRRPQSYFRESVWFGDTEPRIFTTHPKHAGEKYTGTGWHWYDVHETWSFDEQYIGKEVRAEVYTDADEIEFVLNGKTMGRVCPENGIAAMNIPYEKGTLTAVSYKEGKADSAYSLHTTEEPYQVGAFAEKNVFAADNRDLCYIQISVLDRKHQVVVEAQPELTCHVEGAELLTVFSGNPATEDSLYAGKCHAFEGRALAVIRSNAPGHIKITVEGAGLEPAEITVEAK